MPGPLVAILDANDPFHEQFVATVFTIDGADFAVYRLHGTRRFRMLP
jgi:hypothetical protein